MISKKINEIDRFRSVLPLPFPVKICFFIIAITLLKLWLVGSQSITALGYLAHDDYWYVCHAVSILKGQWMGGYDDMTLIKGPFYPIWISLCFLLSIPLSFAQHLLYTLSCFIFIIAIRPLVQKYSSILIIYSILLFNPMSFATDPVTRVIRDSICPDMVILITACSIGMFFSIGENLKKMIVWSAGLGLSFSAFWLTREDGHWMLPWLFIFIIISIYLIWKKQITDRIKRILICLAPVFILFISIFSISLINWVYYKNFAVTDFLSLPFQEAYGSLIRVKPAEFIPQDPVSRETMERIYAVSPAFRELKSYLDVDSKRGWLSGIRVWEKNAKGVWLMEYPEIKDGEYYLWISWAFRDAVAQAGYYSSAEKEVSYYRRLAAEVNSACNTGLLESVSGKRVGFIPPWRNVYFKPLIRTFINSVDFVINFRNFYATPLQSAGSEESLTRIEKVTESKISPAGNNNLNILDSNKIKILTFIGKIYQIFTPIISLISILLFIILFIKSIIKRMDFVWCLITFSLLIAVFSRLWLLTMVSVVSGNAIITVYTISVYPLMIAFILLVIYKTVIEIKTIFQKKEIIS